MVLVPDMAACILLLLWHCTEWTPARVMLEDASPQESVGVGYKVYASLLQDGT